jgi:hypothetical protein
VEKFTHDNQSFIFCHFWENYRKNGQKGQNLSQKLSKIQKKYIKGLIKKIIFASLIREDRAVNSSVLTVYSNFWYLPSKFLKFTWKKLEIDITLAKCKRESIHNDNKHVLKCLKEPFLLWKKVKNHHFKAKILLSKTQDES